MPPRDDLNLWNNLSIDKNVIFFGLFIQQLQIPLLMLKQEILILHLVKIMLCYPCQSLMMVLVLRLIKILKQNSTGLMTMYERTKILMVSSKYVRLSIKVQQSSYQFQWK